MKFFNNTDSRAVEALERIAFALETLAGVSERGKAPEDSSAVLYTDDMKDLQREIRKDYYAERTGIQLAWDEDPPEVPGKDWEDEDA